jgi:23S rRNA pseudouridine1911/1915/1917 synthase
MSEPLIFKVEADASRLDLFLARRSGQSREFVKQQILKGNVAVNEAPALKASQILTSGDQVSVTFHEDQRLELTAVKGELEVLYEDSDLLVINKAQGVVVHPAQGHRGETLVHHLLYYFQNQPEFSSLSPVRPGIVHRLDRGTSGVILIAKNRSAQEGLCRGFKDRLMKKEYESLVWGKMKSSGGKFHSLIGRHVTDRKKMSAKTQEGREAVTRWQKEKTFDRFTHVRLLPETGRTHQLRVHLSEGGFAIVGDDLYGRRGSTRFQGLPPKIREALESVKYPFLHARSLTFSPPKTGESLHVEAARPKIFDQVLKLLEEFDCDASVG